MESARYRSNYNTVSTSFLRPGGTFTGSPRGDRHRFPCCRDLADAGAKSPRALWATAESGFPQTRYFSCGSLPKIAASMLRIDSVKLAARIPRFHVPVTPLPGAEIELPAWAARHCAVLRLRRGDAVVVFDGAGGEFAAELTLVSDEGTRARVLSGRAVERESPLGITLAQCISGGDRMDLTLQKSTELGVARIVPIASERSIVKLSQDRADRRVAHWRKVVIAACEQCGRNRIPDVAGIIELDTFLSEPPGDALRLLLAPDAEAGLKRFEPPMSVILLVGPEGGLAPQERRQAESRGFLPVRFGPRVLRTETAPIAVIAAMQGLWGDC